MIESLRKLGKAHGDKFDLPTPSGERGPSASSRASMPTALIRIFVRDASGKRPLYGSIARFQDDPHWRDYLQFHEYFHGDTGVGLGAAHQTGWTGLVASLIDEWRQK